MPASATSATAPKGITSMKRTSQGRSRVSRASETTSSSLKPRTTTALIFIGSRPTASARAIPASTRSTRPPRVMRPNFCGSSVSRLTFTRRSPARARSAARYSSRIPFVVMERSRIPGTAPIAPTRSTTAGRTVGSPPVRRTLFTPSSAAMRTSSSNSSSRSSSSGGRKSIPSSGMQ